MGRKYILAIFVALAACLGAMVGLSAAWGDGNYGYRQEIYVNQSGSGTVTNIPYLVNGTGFIDTATLISGGKMESDCDDLKVLDDDSSTIYYEFENATSTNYGCDTSSTIIWAMEPSLPTGGANEYMYYGYASATSQEAAEDVWDNNYVAVYHFGEEQGLPIDSTSNNNDCNDSSNLDWETSGKFGAAISFDNDGYALAPADSSFESVYFTLEAWVYPTDSTEEMEIVGYDTDSFRSWRMHKTHSDYGNDFECDIYDDTNGWIVIDTELNVTVDQWYYVACTKNATHLCVWQDGVLIDCAADSDDPNFNGPNGLFIGTTGPGQEYSAGFIDEIRISNVTRTADEINRSYNQGLSTLQSEETAPEIDAVYDFTITLDSPADDSTNTSQDITFAFTVDIQNTTLTNCSVWGNWTGTWADNTTNTTEVANGSATYITINDIALGSNHVWNVECYNETIAKFASANYTLDIEDQDVPTWRTIGSNESSINQGDAILLFAEGYDAYLDSALLQINTSNVSAVSPVNTTPTDYVKNGCSPILEKDGSELFVWDMACIHNSSQDIYHCLFNPYFSGSPARLIKYANSTDFSSAMTRNADTSDVSVPQGSGGTWDDYGTDDPTWIYDDVTGTELEADCGAGYMYILMYTGTDGSTSRTGIACNSDEVPNTEFTKYSGNKCSGTSGSGCVLTNNNCPGIDDTHSYGGALEKFNDTTWRYYYTGYNGTGYTITHADSTDLVNWTSSCEVDISGTVGHQATNPEFLRGDDGSPLIIDGQKFMTWTDFDGTHSDGGYIANSTDNQTWNMVGQFLALGSAGACDDYHIYSPQIHVLNDTTYRVTYSGAETSGITADNGEQYYADFTVSSTTSTPGGWEDNQSMSVASSDTWTYSNFTWSDPDLTDVTISFRIKYNDTSGNENTTDAANFDIGTGAVTTTCNTCTDCSNYIQNSTAGDTVQLVTDLTTTSDCIDFGTAHDIIFDCNGYSLDGDDGYTDYGVDISNQNNTVKGCSYINDFGYGIFMDSSADNVTIYNLTINSSSIAGIQSTGSNSNYTDVTSWDNVAYGLYIISADNSVITGCNFSYNGGGMFIDKQASASTGHNITDSVFIGNTNDGITLDDDSDNLWIYNNNFTGNGDDDIQVGTGADSFYNITKTAATNIVGGSNKGGNYYSSYTGKDWDGDGIGDTSYEFYSGSYDYLPLMLADFSTVSVVTADGDQNWTFSAESGDNESVYLNFSSTGNSNQTITFTAFDSLANSTVVAAINTSTNLSLDDMEEITILIQTNSSAPAGSYSGNITWASYNDTSQTGNITIEFTIANLAANIDITNSTWSAAFQTGSTQDRYFEINNTGNYNATNCNMSYSGSVGAVAFDQSDFNVTNTSSVQVKATFSGSAGTDSSARIDIICTATAGGGTDSDSVSGSITITAATGGGGGGGGTTPGVDCAYYDALPLGGFSGSAPEGEMIRDFDLRVYNGNESQTFTASLSTELTEYCQVTSLLGSETPAYGIEEFIINCTAPESSVTGHVLLTSSSGCEDSRPITIAPGTNIFDVIQDIIEGNFDWVAFFVNNWFIFVIIIIGAIGIILLKG